MILHLSTCARVDSSILHIQHSGACRAEILGDQREKIYSTQGNYDVVDSFRESGLEKVIYMDSVAEEIRQIYRC